MKKCECGANERDGMGPGPESEQNAERTKITAKCFGEKPTADLTLLIKVVR